MQDIALEQGIAVLCEHIAPLTDVEHIPLSAALHRVVACDVVAHMDNPPFHRSPVDGFALCSADTVNATVDEPAVLTVIGEICAGHVFDGSAQPHTAVRIMTGAPIPEGYDAVVPQEWVRYEPNTITVPRQLLYHQNYCVAGEDIAKGTVVVREGETLTVAHIGVLATLGHLTVPVYRKLKVAIASIGDELLPMGALMQPGKVYNSNMYMLQGRLQELGCEVTSLDILSDNVKITASILQTVEKDFDIILTTGAVSVGKMDIMHDVVPLVGDRLFWRLQLKPGSPVLAYQMPHALGIALSGNPFASLATFELLVRPVLAYASHDQTMRYHYAEAVMGNAFTKPSQGRRFIRGQYDGHTVVVPDQHSPGSLFSAIHCNALIDVPAGTDPLAPGDTVRIVVL